jgi:hypothetical protein
MYTTPYTHQHVYHRVVFYIEREMIGEIVNLYTESLPAGESGKAQHVHYHFRHYDEKAYENAAQVFCQKLKHCTESIEKVFLSQEQLEKLLKEYPHKLAELTYEDFEKIGFIDFKQTNRGIK